mgnify:FL=1
MRQIVPIGLSGRIDRRSLPNRLNPGDVLIRENFSVEGIGEEKRCRKVAGATRFSDTNTGTSYVWGTRYYTKVGGSDVRKTYAFNNNGKLYFIDDNGAETELLGIFSPIARPCSETMRISSNDVLLFSEGISTGMYSHDGNPANNFQKETAVTLNIVDMVSYLDRLFAIEENSEDVNFSKNLAPTNFTDSTDAGIITVGAKRSSKLQKLVLLGEAIYFLKQDSIWRLSGRSPAEFEMREVISHLGCAARGSVQNTDNGIIFLGSDYEFYFFGGTADSLKMLSYNVAIGGDLTKNLIPIINRDKMDSIVSEYHDKTYRCSFVENGKVTNNLEYCFSTANETDWFTRDFNISCYIKWDRFPDKHELLTGRTDLGRLMKMNQGLNVDNNATNPVMPIKLQSAFVGSTEPRNVRFKRAYINWGVLGAEPIKVYYLLDCRTALSDAASDSWIIRGEKKTVAGMNIASQRAITSRVNLKYGKSKGKEISFLIDHSGKDLDLEIQSIDVLAITPKEMKLSQKVAA